MADKKEDKKNKQKKKYRYRINLRENKSFAIQIVGLLVITLLLIEVVTYAIVVPRFTVEFDSDGGTPVNSIKVVGKNTIRQPEDPRKDGYFLEDWRLNGHYFDFSQPITRDVTLTANWAPLARTGLNPTEYTLRVNDSFAFEVSGVGDVSMMWSTSDDKVLTVDSNGKVTAITPGEATITVVIESEELEFNAKVTVTP